MHVSSPALVHGAAPARPTDEHLRAEMLLDVCLAIAAITELDPLLAFILDTAADVVDCEAASILLYDEASGRLRFAAATGSDPEQLAQIPVPIAGSIAGAIFRENRSLVVDDTAHDERHYDVVGKAVAFTPRQLVGVPLRVGGTPIGVLEALNPHAGTFPDHAVETLSLIAAQAAVAVRNAQQQTALREAYDTLSRLDRMKSRFMAIASHELRTPLATVLGFAALIEEEADGPLAEFATAVSVAAAKAQEVVASMEMLSRLDDPLAPDLERVLVQDVVHRVAEGLGPTARAHGVELRLALQPEPVWVGADAVELGKAIGIVVDNALAFAPAGSMVQVRLESDTERVDLTVRDEGLGLAEDERERIFAPFYQVADPDTREHEGVGLGLTMARRIVERIDGTLVAESEGLGAGSTFRFRLPTRSAPV